eukprot:jgi/Botrbrau1/22019/Bobra.0024s0033.1
MSSMTQTVMAAPTEIHIKRAPVFVTIDALRPETSGHNVKAKVLDSTVVLNRPGRYNSAPSRIAECTIGDSTGCIIFTARNEQVDIAKPGKFIILRNAKVDMFRGSMRLAVNLWGKVEEDANPTEFEVKTDHNLSLIEYELVQLQNTGAAAGTEEPSPAQI